MLRARLLGPTLILILQASAVFGQAAVDVRFFEQHIRPVLATRCIKCHGDKKQEGNLRLDSLSAILEGGDSGPAATRGEPDASLLIEALRYEGPEMPPSEPLEAEQVEHFVAWIAAKMPWPEHAEPLRDRPGEFGKRDRGWWAIQPLSRPEVPRIDDEEWSRNEIDRFVLRKLQARGMRPAARADKVTLVRRLYFTLIGLPPTPAETAQFVNDPTPDAWENQIDRLLADSRYGEHWARYWLDLVRYAESDGWKQDAYRPHIWRYRDYVVNSFNADTPYPKFVRQQLAGDEMPNHDPENLAATGYLRLGIYEYNQRNARAHWNDILNELTDVTGDVFLGIGMACSRCHDHKFDPILQRDYYALRAFFEPIIWDDQTRYASDEQRSAYEQQQAAWLAQAGDLRQQLAALEQPYYDRKLRATLNKFPLDIQACMNKPIAERTSWDQQMVYLIERQVYEEGTAPEQTIKGKDLEKYEGLKKELAKLAHLKPKPLPVLMAAADFPGAISPTVIPNQDDVPVDPGYLTVLQGLSQPDIEPLEHSTGRRTALAKWIGQADNPLTTRVIVNRIWQQHFGQGIVATPSDFGHLGQAPTHPELLDWLTADFVDHGWRLKRLHKLILMSATWQQSADHPRAMEYQERDPMEGLIWRARIRRLSAEQIRDRMLCASGELVTSKGGPSVAGDVPRRSLYVKSFRNTPNTLLHAFDMANGLKSVAQRDTTTTPTQSLMMINGDYVLQRANQMAGRLMKHDWQAPVDLLSHAFQLAWGRTPTESELQDAAQFVRISSSSESVDRDRLADFCHVLLNTSEFLYLD